MSIDLQIRAQTKYARSHRERIPSATFGTRDWANVALSTASPASVRKYEALQEHHLIAVYQFCASC